MCWTLTDWLTFCSVQNRRQVNGESTLSISKVRREFLNVPFRCHVVSPADRKTGLLYLQEGAVCSLGYKRTLELNKEEKCSSDNYNQYKSCKLLQIGACFDRAALCWLYFGLFEFLQLTAALSSSLLRSASVHLWPHCPWQPPSSSVEQTLCWLTGTFGDYSPNKKVVYNVEMSDWQLAVRKNVESKTLLWALQLQAGSSTTPTSATSNPTAAPTRQPCSPWKSFPRNWRRNTATLCTSEAEMIPLEKVWRRSFFAKSTLDWFSQKMVEI